MTDPFGADLLASGDDEEIEQSFGIETGRYRGDDGEFVDGSPPTDFDQEANRFRANDGEFKDRSQDLGMFTRWDASAEDDATDFSAEDEDDFGLF